MSLLPQERKPRWLLAVAWFFTSAAVGFLLAISVAFLPRDPSEVLAAVPVRMAKISSVHVDLAYEVDGPVGILEEDAGSERFSGKVSGGLDRHTPDSWRAILRGMGTSQSRNGKTQSSAEARILGDDGYLRIASPPEFRGVSFENFSDRWIRLDIADLIRAARKFARLGSSEAAFSQKEEILLAFLLGRAQVLRVEGEARADVRGTYQYRVVLDEERLRSFILAAAALTAGGEPSSEFVGAVDAFLESLGPMRGSIAVGKRDRLLAALALSGTIRGRRGVSNVGFTIRFHDYGKPVEVSAPGDAQTVEEITRNIFGGLFGRGVPLLPYIPGLTGEPGGRLSAPEAPAPTEGLPAGNERDTDADGLPDLLEAFYRSNRHNPDTDADGVTDGEEVRRGLNPAGPGKLFQFGLPQ